MLGSWRPISGILTYFAYWYSMYVYIYIYPSLSNNSCNIVPKHPETKDAHFLWTCSNQSKSVNTHICIYILYIPFRICNRLPHQRQSHTNRRSTAASSTLAVFISMACADQFQFQTIFTCFFSHVFFTCFPMFSHAYSFLYLPKVQIRPKSSKYFTTLEHTDIVLYISLQHIKAYHTRSR